MEHTIEIFTLGSEAEAKVDCKSCPKSCATRDQVSLTAEVLMNQLLAIHGDEVAVKIHDYSGDDKEAVLQRQNELYRENGVSRLVNKVLINPLAPKIWPAVYIDGRLKSEGTLIDATRIGMLLEV